MMYNKLNHAYCISSQQANSVIPHASADDKMHPDRGGLGDVGPVPWPVGTMINPPLVQATPASYQSLLVVLVEQSVQCVVFLSVWAITFEQNDLLCRHLVRWFIRILNVHGQIMTNVSFWLRMHFTRQSEPTVAKSTTNWAQLINSLHVGLLK